jgi:hypothetical protein
VTVNRLFLDYVSGDSDIRVWIGNKTNPFANHITLSDSVLSSLTASDNDSSSTADRWADINSGNLAGNVLVVAADPDGSNDYFKLSKVETTCVASISIGEFTTYTQGGWGANPSGNNAGALLQSKFSAVYTSGSVQIGGTYKATFNSSSAIKNFLPQGGTAGKLTANLTNPTGSPAGVLGGQLLALRLNVDFSNKGITEAGLANLIVVSGPMAGKKVSEVLYIANTVVGGGSLPNGLSLADINETMDAINNNFDNGTSNDGYLKK